MWLSATTGSAVCGDKFNHRKLKMSLGFIAGDGSESLSSLCGELMVKVLCR